MPGAWTEHRRNNRRNIDGTTEHRRNIDGTSTELRITHERAPPRTRGGWGPEGTGKALKPPQPKRKSKFYVFDGTPSPPLCACQAAPGPVDMCFQLQWPWHCGCLCVVGAGPGSTAAWAALAIVTHRALLSAARLLQPATPAGNINTAAVPECALAAFIGLRTGAWYAAAQNFTSLRM